MITNLAIAYSASTTVRLALEHQNTDYDRDIARCVRVQISGVIADQIDALIHLARHLGISVVSPV